MALPSTTDWDLSYNDDVFTTGAKVLTTTPLKVLQNLDYSLRRNRMLASHVFTPDTISAGAFTTAFDSMCYGPNVLGTSISTNIAGYVLCWGTSGATSFQVRVHNATYGTLSLTVAAGGASTSKIWRALTTGTFTAPGDDTAWTYTVDGLVSGGGGRVAIAGVGLFY